MIKTLSWNVNGIRACHRHGFVDVMQKTKADIVGLQEVRALPDQIPEDVKLLTTYPHQYYFAAEKKGYSGVAILSKQKADDLIEGLGVKDFDKEGRVITGVFKELAYLSIYFPNSQDGGKRVAYKIEFCLALQEWLKKISKKYPDKPIVVAGDYNIAHEEIDLARPDDNHNSAGFLPQEREWMSVFLKSGWIDTYRKLHPDSVKYSWWSARTQARERNIGWRIDYHAIHEKFVNRIQSADILDSVYGSDHCPVTLTLS